MLKPAIASVIIGILCAIGMARPAQTLEYLKDEAGPALRLLAGRADERRYHRVDGRTICLEGRPGQLDRRGC